MGSPRFLAPLVDRGVIKEKDDEREHADDTDSEHLEVAEDLPSDLLHDIVDTRHR